MLENLPVATVTVIVAESPVYIWVFEAGLTVITRPDSAGCTVIVMVATSGAKDRLVRVRASSQIYHH